MTLEPFLAVVLTNQQLQLVRALLCSRPTAAYPGHQRRSILPQTDVARLEEQGGAEDADEQVLEIARGKQATLRIPQLKPAS